MIISYSISFLIKKEINKKVIKSLHADILINRCGLQRLQMRSFFCLDLIGPALFGLILYTTSF